MATYKFTPLEGISGKEMTACRAMFPVTDEKWQRMADRLRKHFTVTGVPVVVAPAFGKTIPTQEMIDDSKPFVEAANKFIKQSIAESIAPAVMKLPAHKPAAKAKRGKK